MRTGDLASVRAHAREGAPDEICGILAGRRNGADVVVEQVFRTRNAHTNPRTEYLIDPAEMLRVLLHVEDDLGLDVVGFYHSHPAGPPRLSATDHARATWPDAAYLLVWLAPEEGLGAWTWDDAAKAFLPAAIEEVAGASFVSDAREGVVHRLATAGPACGVDAIPREARQEFTDEFKATMVLKTRHWRACPRCWS